MPDLTDEEIADLRRLERELLPGRWKEAVATEDGHTGTVGVIIDPEGPAPTPTIRAFQEMGVQTPVLGATFNDLKAPRFAAAARNALPRLLQEIERRRRASAFDERVDEKMAATLARLRAATSGVKAGRGATDEAKRNRKTARKRKK